MVDILGDVDQLSVGISWQDGTDGRGRLHGCLQERRGAFHALLEVLHTHAMTLGVTEAVLDSTQLPPPFSIKYLLHQYSPWHSNNFPLLHSIVRNLILCGHLA